MGVFEWIVCALLIVALFFLYAIIDLLTESKFIQKEQLNSLKRNLDYGAVKAKAEELEKLEKDYRKGKIKRKDYLYEKGLLEDKRWFYKKSYE